jgi:hypothetical protein
MKMNRRLLIGALMMAALLTAGAPARAGLLDIFREEILPELEGLMESARRRFRERPDPEQEKKLEQEFKRLKEELSV